MIVVEPVGELTLGRRGRRYGRRYRGDPVRRRRALIARGIRPGAYQRSGRQVRVLRRRTTTSPGQAYYRARNRAIVQARAARRAARQVAALKRRQRRSGRRRVSPSARARLAARRRAFIRRGRGR